MNSVTKSTQALPASTRIEEFLIERVLGAGGFGITYLARDTRLDRKVVIKENLPAQFCFRDPTSMTVAPRHTHGDDAENFVWSLENFSKEAAMLASLDHPGIVKVLRSFQAFGTAYFVMPYVEGLALDELVKQRHGQPFTEAELRGLLERVLSALAYLHDRGIYHRDIKPGNLLITNDGIPVLIDFGSARQRLSERSMTVVESVGYTPFEQLQSRGNVGPWSDLYALGATLVKVMTGEAPPKANDRAFDDPFVLLSKRSELKASYSSSFLCCLDRALGMKPADRWQDAGEWLKALREPTVAQQQQPVRHELELTPVPAVSWMPENLERNPEFRSTSTIPTAVQSAATPERNGKPVPWIIAACIALGLFAFAKIITGNNDGNRPVTVADDSALQQERQKAEVDRQALEASQRESKIKVQAEELARQIAEKQRFKEESKKAQPRVQFATSAGVIVVELNAEKAPITVANFLEYVNKKHYDGTVFHRVIGNFLIQGGGFAAEGTGLVEKTTGKGIKNEASNGLKNDIGTVAMARTGDPDSATSQFFINVAANNNLNAPSFDGHGYAVFGKVVEGMDVVNAIKAVPTGNKPLTMIHPATGEKITQSSPDVPNENIVIETVSIIE